MPASNENTPNMIRILFVQQFIRGSLLRLMGNYYLLCGTSIYYFINFPILFFNKITNKKNRKSITCDFIPHDLHFTFEFFRPMQTDRHTVVIHPRGSVLMASSTSSQNHQAAVGTVDVRTEWLSVCMTTNVWY